MARETLIVFLYDTVIGQKEEDDPASALIYFHPTWVSVEQKTALCGQIIGTAQCVRNLFCRPEVVSLRSGNFFITEKGRYLFVVGTDRNSANSQLEFKAKTLFSLLEFLHEDFEKLANNLKSESFTSKLSSMFDNYIKMLVYARSIFSQNSFLMLTKSSSNVFMDAIHVLDSCQELNYVLGGALMYHNKVVATHLSTDLINRLILIDPYRNKCSAEAAQTTFIIPPGVQLLEVYISGDEYSKLLGSSNRARNSFHQFNIEDIRKNMKKCDEDIQDTFLITAMKRDQSLIFTAVPEDSSITSELPYIPTTKKTRPKFLNLKSVFGGNNIEPKSKVTASTPICGQTSVCSTPLKDLKKFVYQNPLKICHSEDVENSRNILHKELKKFDEFGKKIPHFNVNCKLYDRKKYSSFSNMNDIYNSIFDKKSIDNSHILPTKNQLSCSFRTITDPTFPVFKRDGTVVSKLYCEENIPDIFKLFQNGLQIHENHISGDHVTEIDSDVRSNSTSDSIDVLKANISTEPSKNQKYKNPTESPLDGDPEASSKSSTYCHYFSGVPQTPLMSKLTMVPCEENVEGSSSALHHQKKPAAGHNLLSNQTYRIKEEKENTRSRTKSSLQKCVLFVCGQRNIVLSMLLEEKSIKEYNIVKRLWDICTDRLNKLENDLRYSMESSKNLENEPYNYLQHDSELQTVKRGGPWSGNDLESLHYLHDDFNNSDYNLTEILMRGADNIIFAHHSGSTEVFYSETANFIAGLPPPVDPMGLLQLKAKKRLERDHTLILI
nr:uncharacterized protein LOC111502102 isoform X1 [Leptinotarsa decemlineata]